jgi:hypothetical protein
MGVALVPAGAPAAVGPCPAGVAYRVGAAKADITPTQWPVTAAAYSIGLPGVAATHPFYARTVAIQSCANGQVMVLTSLDSQGYFAAYKEDPPSLDPTAGYGTAAIRAIVEAQTKVPATNILISATHTHNSPDSVGVWGGGSNDNNKVPYLSRVKHQTVASIEMAVDSLRPANLRVATVDISATHGTYAEVQRDPTDYPVDHTMRVLQATDARSCAPISTLVDVSTHADIAGQFGPKDGERYLDPDWPGRVATDLESQLPGESAVVMAGAVGRTGPSFPSGTDPNDNKAPDTQNKLNSIAAYGDILTRRVDTALAGSVAVAPGPIQVVDAHLHEELAEPALIPLFASETGVVDPTTGRTQLGGVMRSILPPYTVGNVLDSEVQTFRLGNLMMAGAPGEAYPQVATELAKRVKGTAISPFVFGLANDQLGYTPPAYEFPVVAAVDGGDEGIFTINVHHGSDIINQHLSAANTLGFPATGTYDGTQGPVNPPDQPPPGQKVSYPPIPNPPEPPETPLSLACDRSGALADTTTFSPNIAAVSVSHGGDLVSVQGLGVRVPSTRRCVSRRRFAIHLTRRRGTRVLSARLVVRGRRVPVHLGRRLRSSVDLRGLAPGRFSVRLTLRLSIGGRVHTLTLVRTYHTCVRRRH